MDAVPYQVREENKTGEISTSVTYTETELSRLVEWTADGSEVYGEVFATNLRA